MEHRRAILWGFREYMGGMLMPVAVVVMVVVVGELLTVQKDRYGCRQENTVFLCDYYCDPVFVVLFLFFTPMMRWFGL